MYRKKKINIVLLDGYTLNPGDLSWEDLSALGHLTMYERTAKEDTVQRAADAHIVLSNKVLLGTEEISRLPNLQYIGLLSTGTNVVDLAFARQRNIVVTNVPAYSTPSVAQHTFALLLEITNRVALHHHSVLKGEWQQSVDFCYWKHPLSELVGKTIGLIGLGDIGKSVARIALAMGMNVLAYRRNPEPAENIRYCSLNNLLQDSDIVSLHCPLTEETANIINSRNLSKMKRGAILLNTGRGGLVDEEALAQALNSGHLSGAGLDVLREEPPKNNSPLIGAKNCYITPHIAWASKAARERLLHTVVENIRAFLRGNPINVVN